MTKLIGAADIGGMTIKLGLFDDHIRLIKSWSIPTDISEHGANILPMLCDGLKAEHVRLSALGIAVPAAVDEQSIARSCTNIGWGTVNLREELSHLMPEAGVLMFGNDATVAAFGELRFGAAKRYNSAYLITLGTGVGGGYAADSRVTAGAHGAAGEIGHIIINPHETKRCMCGRCGCLEQYASAAGIVRLARNLLYIKNKNEAAAADITVSKHDTDYVHIDSPCVSVSGVDSADMSDVHNKELQQREAECRGRYDNRDDNRDDNRVHVERLFNLDIPGGHSSLEELAHFDARDICDAARSGDKLSLYILEIFGECMGLAMSSISCSIDPECFIIGGGMSKAGGIVLDAIRRGYLKYAYPASRKTDIVAAELGNDAGIYGCAVMASDVIR